MQKLLLNIGKILLLLTAILIVEEAAAGTILVTNVLSNSVTLIDETALKPVKELSVGFMPHEVAVTPNGQFALVSNFGDLTNLIPGHSLTSIDIENGKVLQTIELAKKSRPHGVKFISDTQALVTAQGIQSLLVIDFVRGEVIKTIPLPGAGAHMVTTDAELRYAYVANADSGTVCKIDLKTFTVVGEVKVGSGVEGVALTLDENLLLATARKDNVVTVVRTKDLTLLKKIPTGCGPVRVAMFNHGKSAVITNTISGNAQIIDMAALAITNTFNTTAALSPLPVPTNIFVRDDQMTAYIANSFAGNLTLVDLEKGQILKTFKASSMPDGLTVSSLTLANH